MSDDAGFSKGASVRARGSRGAPSLVRQNRLAKPRNLKLLLKGISAEHFERDVTWGEPVGKEVW